MARTVAIGIQNFEDYITKKCFYVDKTKFIGEWWRSNDNTTVVMRPRRFGKTLTMDMVKTFFSLEYENKGETIFGGLDIWQDEEMRALQGTYPVIFLSFADIKPINFEDFREQMYNVIQKAYIKNANLVKSDYVTQSLKDKFKAVNPSMSTGIAVGAINTLCQIMSEVYGKKVLIILDEYDTPMLEAYVQGYWAKAISLLRGFFNSTFKTNPYMERALMTGITRISKESIFSDFNHVQMVTMLSEKYADCFGFTEEEVFTAMDEYNLLEKDKVKMWYDGFSIGDKKDIYNPWSIINYLSNKGKIENYWANSSSNSLVNSLLKTANVVVKQMMEALLAGRSVKINIDEEIVYSRLTTTPKSVFSLLFTSGYLTGSRAEPIDIEKKEYNLYITNKEVLIMFRNMISDWFQEADCSYNEFIEALLKGELKAMNAYMNRIAMATFSFFDSGTRPSVQNEPERFYHGFVLGLIVDLREEYTITSNRESGFGRYDVLLEPKDIEKHDAIILEFKVHDSDEEKDLQETVVSALKQINDMNYSASLIEKGIPADRIKKYGFAFAGKKVLIGK